MTKAVRLGDRTIGAGSPVLIQSMANTDTRDVKKTVAQIRALEKRGCEIVRVSVFDAESAEAIRPIKQAARIPVVADIHFDYRLAIAAMEHGADKIRINPGNIGGRDKLKRVADKAGSLGLPIRVGVNAGSLESGLLRRYGAPCAEALCESAFQNVQALEDCGFSDIVVSIKSSSVADTVYANRMFSEKSEYPLHIGLTEAGGYGAALVKSGAAAGALLLDGIGDTLRVSITGSPLMEVGAAQDILQYCGLRAFHPEIISCPTCGRTSIDVERIAKELKRRTKDIAKPIKIAVMGCVVNGPGEAKEADIGIAGGKGKGAIFMKGVLIKTVPEDRLVDELMISIRELL